MNDDERQKLDEKIQDYNDSLFVDRLTKFVFVPIAAGIAIYLFYGFRFDWVVADNPIHWGSFGDYMGGIANPMIALGALIILFKGYINQKKELKAARDHLKVTVEQSKNDSKKQELYRVIAHIDDRLKNLLSAEVVNFVGSARVPVASIGAVIQSGMYDNSDKQKIQAGSNTYTDYVTYLPLIKEEIVSIMRYLDNYNEIDSENNLNIAEYLEEKYSVISGQCDEVLESFKGPS